MHCDRRGFLTTSGCAVLAAARSASGARATVSPVARPLARSRGPIIDVHMHAYPAAAALPEGLTNRATGAPLPWKNGEEHRAACLAEMRRYNVVKGIVSGGNGDRLAAARYWQEKEPGRFISGAALRGSQDTPLPDLEGLRKAFSERSFGVMGEVTAQYAGLALSDPIFDDYLSLAEEFDVPVSLHTGMMPPGTTVDPCCRTARSELGNPKYVEDALNRHPRLRLNLMHCGWPYLDDTIAVLMQYPQVNADLGAISWLLPPEELHACLRRLTLLGYGKRLMFGSDHMFWPDAIGRAIEAVEAAAFLTDEQQRDIFYGNAVAFFRL